MNDPNRLAIGIALASAGFALGGLIWQLMLYRLSGARLQVRLLPAVLDDHGNVGRNEKGRFKDPPPGETLVSRSGGWWVDLAEIRVTNIGRSAVSVSDVGLEFGSRWRPHSVRGFPLEIHGATADNVIRLDVGESAVIYFDFWQLARARRKEGRTLTVRATARPAGRRRKLSPFWNRWKLEPDRYSLRPWVDLTREVRIYQAFWRGARKGTGHIEPFGPAWYAVLDELSKNDWRLPPRDLLIERLSDSVLDGGEAARVVINMELDLDPLLVHGEPALEDIPLGGRVRRRAPTSRRVEDSAEQHDP